jgi:uncharacterized protein YcbX
MFTSADLDEVRKALDEVRADNAVDVVIRRGAASLPAQNVRVARLREGSRTQVGPQIDESRAPVVVMGSTAFDVQIGDRFTVGGVLYQITFVRPNRRAAVVAEAQAVE